MESFHVRDANAVPNSITLSCYVMRYLPDPLAEGPIASGGQVYVTALILLETHYGES